MKELTEYMVKALVDHPEKVVLRERKSNETTILELSVDSNDFRRIIGRDGNVIKSIRTILNAVALNQKQRPPRLEVLQ